VIRELSPSRSIWIVPISLPGHSLRLFSYMQDKTGGEFFLQRLWTSSTGSKSPSFGLSRIWTSPTRHHWHYFHFWPLVQALGCGPTVESPRSSYAPPYLRRSRVTPPPCIGDIYSGLLRHLGKQLPRFYGPFLSKPYPCYISVLAWTKDRT